jgi:threonine dehydratase
MDAPLSVSLENVKEAAARIRGYIVETPLLEAPLLNKHLGFRLLVKAENLQLAGSFKVRGAFNHMAQLTDDEKKKGVIAISTGNHSQAVAYAASTFGVKSIIVMPQDAPKSKLDNTRRYGAEIVTYDRQTENREEIGQRIACERGIRLIHPYNDPRTIAGQGTCGLEIFEQTKARGVSPAAIIVNCGGGGLAAGISLTRELYAGKKPEIFTAEPEAADKMRQSLAAGQVVKKPGVTICDALAVPAGTQTLPILLGSKSKGLAASDACVEAAMSLAAEHLKLVLEPGGAVALACACLNRAMFQGKTVVAVASGGNVDPEAYIGMLTSGLANRKLLFA